MCCNRCSGMEDRESSPMIMDVCKVAKENSNFRKSVWTGKCMQMTIMSIPPRGEIGLEVHEKTDQMIRVEQGRGIAMMGNCQCRPNMELEISEGDVVFVPAGTWHNIRNIGREPLKLSSTYAPPAHPKGTVQKSREDADRTGARNR